MAFSNLNIGVRSLKRQILPPWRCDNALTAEIAISSPPDKFTRGWNPDACNAKWRALNTISRRRVSGWKAIRMKRMWPAEQRRAAGNGEDVAQNCRRGVRKNVRVLAPKYSILLKQIGPACSKGDFEKSSRFSLIVKTSMIYKWNLTFYF